MAIKACLNGARGRQEHPAIPQTPPEQARAIARLITGGVPQLWHGYGERTWAVLSAGAAAGHDVRVGLEDVLVLPHGGVAASTPNSSQRPLS